MEISSRALWTLLHGMGFGALYLLACSGAFVELYRWTGETDAHPPSGSQRLLTVYLWTMAILAWFAVLTGAYVIYPWYRATPPPGTADLTLFPQRLLLASVKTSGWHSLGMEWKEHVAWFAPISITMVAAVFVQYGRELHAHRLFRSAVLWFTVASFTAAAIAGVFGAMINKYAPTNGGNTIQLTRGDAK